MLKDKALNILYYLNDTIYWIRFTLKTTRVFFIPCAPHYVRQHKWDTLEGDTPYCNKN